MSQSATTHIFIVLFGTFTILLFIYETILLYKMFMSKHSFAIIEQREEYPKILTYIRPARLMLAPGDPYMIERKTWNICLT